MLRPGSPADTKKARQKPGLQIADKPPSFLAGVLFFAIWDIGF